MARVSPELWPNGTFLGREAYETLDEAQLGLSPDPRIIDLTAWADRRHRKGTRDPRKVYAAWDVESPETEIAHDTEVSTSETDQEVNRNSGAYVRWVQQSLNTILGLQMPVDGIRGPITRSATRSFQQQQGLTVDGVVGPQTERALIAAGARNPPDAEPSAPSPIGSTSATSSLRWVLPPDVSAAGERQFVRYDGAPPWNDGRGCATSLAPGARALGALVRANFPGVRDIGGLACRPNTANAAQMSVHGSGRALDIMIPPIGQRANSALGDPIANWLVQNAERLAVQYIIWNRTQWRGRGAGRRDSAYTGPNSHADHVHVELNRDGAARSTALASVAIGAGGGGSGVGPGASVSSGASLAPGQRRPVPAGYRPARRPTPAVVAKANELLRSSHPIGTHIPLTLDGNDYLFAVEWHKHAVTDPVSERLKQWHRGITVYEKAG